MVDGLRTDLWVWVNVAGGPRFTEDNITEIQDSGLNGGQLKKWHLELLSDQFSSNPLPHAF
jgi:hypothetical protein